MCRWIGRRDVVVARPAQPRRGENIRVIVRGDGSVAYRAKVSHTSTTGHRSYSSTEPTLTLARAWQEEMRAKLRRDPRSVELARRQVPTVAEVVDAHVAAKSSRRATTLRGYRAAARRVTDHKIGTLPVDRVRIVDVEGWVRCLVEEHGLAKESVSRSLHLLRAGLNRAVIEQYCTHNPAVHVEPMGRAKPEPEAFTPQEWTALNATAEASGYERIAWLFILLGMRRSEVAGIRWCDIDLDAGWLRVAHSRTIDLNDPKTRRGNRVLPLTETQVNALRTHLSVQSLAHAVGPETFIVTNMSGRGRSADGRSLIGAPVSPDTIGSTTWSELCERAGVTRRSLKTARSTSVTVMRSQGVPDWVVSAWHGHTEEVMKSSYTAVSLEDLLAAAGAREALLRTGMPL